MRARAFAAALASFALAAPARAEDDAPPANFEEYQLVHETSCVGPVDGRLPAPTTWELEGFRYTAEGARLRVVRTSPRKAPEQVRLGVVNAIKDDTPETQANLAEYLERFKAADVDGIVIGGDTADGEMDIEEIVKRVAALPVPVYAVIGNMESRGGFNRALRAAHKAKRNVVNLDLVRVVDADGFDLVSLPGYYDKRYTHQTGSCAYSAADVKALTPLASGVDGPVVLVTHGPPRQSGKGAIDFVPEAGNVGDPDITALVRAAKIPFGIHGHVLEAGGRATDLSGKKEVKPLALADELFLNPGSANSLPWRMNQGGESYGTAAIVTIEGRKAKYELIRSPRRIAIGD